jgi:single-strand DNA-binding protein
VFDTNVTIVGNVLTAPDWRRTTNTNSLVANFKIASTARRLDRETGRWVDGNSLRVRVTCWRKLAEGVASSVMVGDPVVVAGRLYTRDWTDADGNARTAYEMEAVAVGHDLARGRSQFVRNRPAPATSVVEDAGPHVTASATARPEDGRAAERSGRAPGSGEVPAVPPIGYDPVAVVRGGGFDPRADLPPVDAALEPPMDPDPLDFDPEDDPDSDSDSFAPDAPDSAAPRPEAPPSVNLRDLGGSRDSDGPGDSGGAGGPGDPGGLDAAAPASDLPPPGVTGRRARRPRDRVPVPA